MSQHESFSVAGRVVVITGALGQLGHVYARAFLAGGARVAALDARVDDDLLRQRFPGHAGGEALLVLQADVADRGSLEQALAAIERRWGVPDVLLNNAALDAPPDAPAAENGPFETYPESSWDKVMAVNSKGVLLCCQVFGGAMAQAGRGSIINIGSIYGVVSPDQSLYEHRRQGGEAFFKPVAYSASKASLLMLTRYLATYWGARGVRVNSLTLGGVFAGQHPDFVQRYTARVPLGRMAAPDDYVGPVLFLASDAARYMTGANMVVDGGWTAL